MSYRHRVRIEQRTKERASSGAMVEAWVPVQDNVPAMIEAVTGRELIAAAEKMAEATTWIRIRWLPIAIDPTMRVVNDYDGGRVYQIVAVLPDDTQRKTIRMLCSTGLNDGA